MYSFPSFEPVHCYMSSSNCCFLTCIQVTLETGKLVVVIHTVKGFIVVSKVVVYLEFTCFFYDLTDVGNLISGSSAFSKFSLYIWKFSVHVLLKPNLKDFEHDLAAM